MPIESRCKILILDDDPDLRSVLAQLIARTSQCQVVECESFAEMVRNSREVLSTGLAVLDVDLGPSQPNGLDAFAWLRAKDYPGRVLFLTAHGKNHPLVKQAHGFHNVSVKSKPVPHAELLSDVRSALAQLQ